ncbi:NADH:ubiquinone oxidoreductase subunit 5 (chain l)/multisubunit na+/h+ antiporter, mnha subunit [Halogeometricum pallidum JCM 14848]|uniref:NADH:ubiquinone oxidoreductase subunit 5 (Chain l)/multisubunit na+/h+ antiporter, mnha subunit n=1 Tax=Halogeometricum pallidum JCM 14848 TaxID=1227487 RepID=M0CVQ9_HALPD|nr:hydrogen gas-evolving membrane-bound hydrogenase subunit E [Halogeometricum pallidum]ELZ26728.1 NADH:ubiquinone oxidoreductase subunit 5 (chain l)/multisubunit na+/h+ antiporter, mnha subunit [Halogeometricum pallidum JCM 14848]
MQPTPEVVLAVVFLPFVAAALTPAVFRVLGERTAYFAAATALVCFGLVTQLSLAGAHGTVSYEWIPSLGVSLAFYVDGLALLIAFLASGVGVLILTYSGGYMHGEPGQAKYYATLLAFLGSMLGVALASDLISLFVFWELTSLSSFLLIGHYTSESASKYAARKSMLITVSGGLFMLVGFLLLVWASGQALPESTYSLVVLLENADAIREALTASGLLVPALVLVGLGAATKSAQVPFHIWLPNAMEAPTPVSAFLHSATMVKAGVYLVGRLRPLFLSEEAPLLGEWTLLFAILGLATMTVAAILAVSSTDIKELLAYSTASHLGLIVASFGFANEYGAEAGAFHILNHASFKAALFLVAGIVAHEAGTRQISKLSGLRKHLPVTAAIATVASLSMAGIPPFNGFYSKELLFEAAWYAGKEIGGLGYLFPVVAVFGSVFTFLYSVKFASLFFGEENDNLGHVHSPPATMLVPPAILGLLVLGISASATLGLGPETPINAFVGHVYGSVSPGDPHGFSVHFPTELSPYAAMSAVTILVGAALFPFYDRLHDGINALLRGPVRANWWYDGAVEGLSATSVRTIPSVQNGLLRTYATWALASVTVLALGGYAAAGVSLPAFEGFAITLPIFLVLLVAVVGAVAVDIAPSHVAGVLTLSILGFMVAIFYILADAPDLALTQLVVETLVLVIFLLVLNRLPAFYGEVNRSRAARDAVLALAVGATVFVTVLVTTAASPAEPIAGFLAENAGVPAEHPPFFTNAGGGGNIVNVILVDFRAFDTMGEISVVAMTALAILTLIRMRERGETQ